MNGALGAAARKWAVALLLAVGAQLSLIVGHVSWPPRNSVLLALLVVALLSCLPQVARPVATALDRLRCPSSPARLLTSIVVAIAAALILYAEARAQQRPFIPIYQDESSYLIQARMLAHGRLWMPAHPLADFFESFQLVATPIYGSIYFPGAALLFVPGVWLALPFWVMPLLLSAASVGLLYRVIAELFDGVAGLLAAIMLLSLPMFRLVSIMALAQAPAIFLLLLMFVAWLNWRRTRALAWAAMIGVTIGWGLITRPVDALCFALPIALFSLSLYSGRGSGRGGFARAVQNPLPSPPPEYRGREWVRALVTVVIAAVPFLALQIAFNLRVTGSLTRTPFDYYAQQNYPGTQYGFHGFDPAARPVSSLPQKQRFFDEHAVPFLRSHTPAIKLRLWMQNYLPEILLECTPHILLLVLIPVGLLSLRGARRWALFATLPLFASLYFPYVFFLVHYIPVVAPAVLLLLVGGAQMIEQTWPRRRGQLSTFLVCSVIVLSVSESRFFRRTASDEILRTTEPQDIQSALAHLPQTPAIVVFHFAAHSSPHVEPVYNIDVAWPDDAPVIRAHDLDARNIELFRYYAQRQPERAVYRYDRGDGSIAYLGRVSELAR